MTTTQRLMIALLLCVTSSASASNSDLSVMTRNIYLGGDVGRPLTARTPTEFFIAIAGVFAEVEATNFPERAEALADEIEKLKPMIVGLQEVALWRTQSPSDFRPVPNATVVAYDFLPILEDALTRRGLDYEAVVIGTRADVEAPGLTPTGFKDFRLTMRDVILVQRDDTVQISNAANGNFATNAVIPTAAGPITFVRGWASIDVTVGERTARVINTHLEAFAESIRSMQVAELLSGPANTSLPVVLIGDLNSAPGSAPYNELLSAAFADAAEGEEEGFTCCQRSDLRNEESTLTGRIDHVLIRSLGNAKNVKRVGDDPGDRTPSGLWPSDHAGVVAKLSID